MAAGRDGPRPDGTRPESPGLPSVRLAPDGTSQRDVPTRLGDGDVDEFFGDYDDLFDRFALERLDDFFGGERGGLDFLLGRGVRHSDQIAESAVDLDRDLKHGFDEQGWVKPGPLDVCGRGKVGLGIEFGEQFFGYVGREGVEQQEEIAHDAARFHGPSNGFIDEDHEGRNGGVEAQVVEVFGHLLDAGVEDLELFGGGLDVLNCGVDADAVEVG